MPGRSADPRGQFATVASGSGPASSTSARGRCSWSFCQPVALVHPLLRVVESVRHCANHRRLSLLGPVRWHAVGGGRTDRRARTGASAGDAHAKAVEPCFTPPEHIQRPTYSGVKALTTSFHSRDKENVMLTIANPLEPIEFDRCDLCGASAKVRAVLLLGTSCTSAATTPVSTVPSSSTSRQELRLRRTHRANQTLVARRGHGAATNPRLLSHRGRCPAAGPAPEHLMGERCGNSRICAVHRRRAAAIDVDRSDDYQA
jgi:hypothetical protein